MDRTLTQEVVINIFHRYSSRRNDLDVHNRVEPKQLFQMLPQGLKTPGLIQTTADHAPASTLPSGASRPVAGSGSSPSSDYDGGLAKPTGSLAASAPVSEKRTGSEETTGAEVVIEQVFPKLEKNDARVYFSVAYFVDNIRGQLKKSSENIQG